MSTRILQGDCRDVLKTLPANSVHLCITSPPYWNLRSYIDADHPDKAREIGSERTPAEYIAALVAVFAEVRRVLRDDGLCVVNLGDGYNNFRSQMGPGQKFHGRENLHGKPAQTERTRGTPDLKEKDLMMMPARVALALQADGWYLRSMLPWLKRSVMPESVEDRPVSAIEYVFMLAKQPSYYWDHIAVRREGAYPAGTKAAKGSAARAGTNGVNSRPAEYATYSGTRNFRNSDLFYDSLTAPYGLITDSDGEPLALDVNPQPIKLKHYAAYPPKLIEPFVRAATPERGCCPECGRGWVRETDRVQEPDGLRNRGNGSKSDYHTRQVGSGQKLQDWRDANPTRTTGWRQACQCTPASPVPATILDPFFGVGTTALVADRLGRDCIGIDLNPDYGRMATDRVTDDAGLFAEVSGI